MKEQKSGCSCQNDSNSELCRCPERVSKFIQPCLLLLLQKSPAHGYELMEEIPQFGFVDKPADPALIYRNLRKMEEEGFVRSSWDNRGSGPAKRIYEIAPDGEELLEVWARGIEYLCIGLNRFLNNYKEIRKDNPKA